MTNEEQRIIKDWAYGIANCAIHAYRIDKLEPGTWLYEEIASKIDFYNKVTYHD